MPKHDYSIRGLHTWERMYLGSNEGTRWNERLANKREKSKAVMSDAIQQHKQVAWEEERYWWSISAGAMKSGFAG